MTQSTWVERWYVPRSEGDGVWTVARKADNTWGCDCPAWRFSSPRRECHHIRQIKARTPEIDSAEILCKLAGMDELAKAEYLTEVYTNAGFVLNGEYPEDEIKGTGWAKQHYDDIKHRTDMAVVTIFVPRQKTIGFRARIGNTVRVMVKPL